MAEPHEEERHTPEKLPSISRKITACEACRKHKIKCHMRDSQPPCARCTRMGLRCTLNRNLQTLIEDDSVWKNKTHDRIEMLENAVRIIGAKAGVADLSSLLSISSQPALSEERPVASPYEVSSTGSETAQATHDSASKSDRPTSIDPSGGPAAVPASYISQVRPQNARWREPSIRNPASRDIISRGVLSIEQAQILFDLYRLRLDHFVYTILNGHDTLEKTRASSSLLTAAICTVGALHYESSDALLFERCLKDFVESSAASIFSRHNNLDDVRAMCIGAFWLHEVSWILAGSAVRLATELNLHLSYRRAIEGHKDSYLSLRLYYLVYCCDHHCSIAFGRPPMSRTDEPILNCEKLLDTPFAVADDARLVSQIKLWIILSHIFELFGADVQKPLNQEDVSRLRRFMISLDSWRVDWIDRFFPNAYVGNYPRKGVNLHHHFAKLYLCAHIFRGLNPHAGNVIEPETREISNTAMLSATAILRELVSDADIRSFLHGLPLYFHAMIPFAAVFALKMVNDFPNYINSDVKEVFELLDHSIVALQSTASQIHRQHVIVDIAHSLVNLLTQYKEKQPQTASRSVTAGGVQTQSRAVIPLGMDQTTLEPFGLASYDFLSDQNPLSGFDAFPFDFYYNQGP